jgi:hypothetical protein
MNYSLTGKDKIDELRSIRHRMLGYSEKEDVIQYSLQLIKEKFHSQTASIFLFTKEGLLSRCQLIGNDFNGNSIDDLGFAESHKVGESFTGKAAIPVSGYYGETQWTNDPENDGRINPKSLELYSKAIGKVQCVIDMPLDGKNRTHGVIEVINKIDSNNKPLKACQFTPEEVDWLSIIGSYISTAISNIKKEKQMELMSKSSNILIKSPSDDINTKKSFEDVINVLVSKDTAFKACIVRRLNKDNLLQVLAKVCESKIDWEKRIDEDREPGFGFCGKVFKNKKRLIMPITPNSIGLFKNTEWISENGFKSFGCFPLLSKGEPLGTLSLFSSYDYQFHDSSCNFLEIIASDMASFIQRKKQEDYIRELEHLGMVGNEKLSSSNSTKSQFSRIDSRLIHEFNIMEEKYSSEKILLPMLVHVKNLSWDSRKIPDYHELYRLGDIIGCRGSHLSIDALSKDDSVIYVESSHPGGD